MMGMIYLDFVYLDLVNDHGNIYLKSLSFYLDLVYLDLVYLDFVYLDVFDRLSKW